MEKQKIESKELKKFGCDEIYQHIYIGGYNGH
jgi:hypothetical protein